MTIISQSTETSYQVRCAARAIYRIASRYVRLCERAGADCSSVDSIVMDVLGTHEFVCPLDLEALLKADDCGLYHDVHGIMRHYNRTTRKLDDHFSPRYFKQLESTSAQGG
jgi:hypothetical protein